MGVKSSQCRNPNLSSCPSNAGPFFHFCNATSYVDSHYPIALDLILIISDRIGRFGFFPSNSKSKHAYPAQLADIQGGLLILEWYYGNTYQQGEKITQGQYHLSLEDVLKILQDQRDYGGVQLGCVFKNNKVCNQLVNGCMNLL